MIELDEEIDQQYGISKHYSSQIPQWLKYTLVVLLVTVPVLVVFLAPSKRWGVALFAYINCVLYGFFAVHFYKKRTLCSLIPIVTPIWLLTGNCIGIIYFAIFYPDATYRTMTGYVSYFAGGIRYQLAIFLFLLVYFVSMSRFLRNERVVPQYPSMVSNYIGYLSIALAVPIICFHAYTVTITKTVGLIWTSGSWGFRLYNYSQTLLFVAGVVFVRLSRIVKMTVIVFLILVMVFYSLVNARTWAILPIASVFCGFFLFSEAKVRTKTTLLLVCIVAVPWFLLIANTVRLLLGVAGGKYEDIGYRLAAFKEWKYVAERVPAGVNFFGRIFYVSGNKIVADTPSQRPYKHFSPIEYAKEVAISMLPGPVQRSTGIMLDITKAQYTGTWVLRDYDLNVSETTDIEISMIGNLWMLGGYIPVLIGGILLALIHWSIAWVVRRAWIQNPDKGIFYFALFFYNIFGSFNLDMITLWRGIVLQLVFAYFGFKLISPFLKIGYAGMEERHEESVLGMH